MKPKLMYQEVSGWGPNGEGLDVMEGGGSPVTPYHPHHPPAESAC